MAMRKRLSGFVVSLALACGLAAAFPGGAMAESDDAVDVGADRKRAGTSKPPRPPAAANPGLKPMSTPRRDEEPESSHSRIGDWGGNGVRVIRYGVTTRAYFN
jgi:hypothetical protein